MLTEMFCLAREPLIVYHVAKEEMVPIAKYLEKMAECTRGHLVITIEIQQWA